MPSIFSNLFKKHKKMSSKSDATKNEEPTYSIQPHPAKTNDPADLAPEQTGGLASNPNERAFHARDPHIPTTEVMASLEQPATREELQARQAELNK